MTDHWRAYAEFLPEKFILNPKQKRIQLKDIMKY